jgi:hypothetical protein
VGAPLDSKVQVDSNQNIQNLFNALGPELARLPPECQPLGKGVVTSLDKAGFICSPQGDKPPPNYNPL